MQLTQTKQTIPPLCSPCLHLSHTGTNSDLSEPRRYIPTRTYEGGKVSRATRFSARNLSVSSSAPASAMSPTPAMIVKHVTTPLQDWHKMSSSRHYHIDQILDKPGPRTDSAFAA